MAIQACNYLCKLLAYGILFSQLKVTGINCSYLLALNTVACIWIRSGSINSIWLCKLRLIHFYSQQIVKIDIDNVSL